MQATVLLVTLAVTGVKMLYTPDWTSLDTRPLPDWYDNAKVGILVHFGLFSVPAIENEWFWMLWHNRQKRIVKYIEKHYPPGFTYQEFASMFKAEFFDPIKWADLFAASGAKYVVLTSKHHDGFSLYPSKIFMGWNSVDVGPKRDFVGELAKAVTNRGMKFGVYYSLYEWFNPLYLRDKANKFNTSYYVDYKMINELKQLVTDYHPSVIWVDGDWEASDEYWKSKKFLAWLYNESPVKAEVVVNDRWGKRIAGHHGDFYNFLDRFNNRTIQNHKWENAFTVDAKSWGYRRDMDVNDVLSLAKLIDELVTTVSCGGNVLINVGATTDGTITPIFQERLLSLGKWLSISGEAIYGTKPWNHQNDTYNQNVWYTCREVNITTILKTGQEVTFPEIIIYATTLQWPKKQNELEVANLVAHLHSGLFKVELLGNQGTFLNWTISHGIAKITLLDRSRVRSKFAWTLKISKK